MLQRLSERLGQVAVVVDDHVEIDQAVEWITAAQPKLRNYSYEKLLTLKKCQECKVKLEGDVFISDNNRLCMKCWENTFTYKGGYFG